jgi:hypothetical protein
VLSSADILRLFEEGHGLHAVDRALLLLARSAPERSHEELVALAIGQRDAALLELRAALFGDRLEAWAVCPTCGERVEIELACGDLFAEVPESGPRQVRIGAAELTIRAPDSRDLAAIATSPGVARAHAILFERCVTGATESLSVEERAAVADAILTTDPHAETLLSLACPSCDRAWELVFDIVSFLWNELAAEAQRVLRDIDVLARTYGWSEAEILGLSEMRRNLYVGAALS